MEQPTFVPRDFYMIFMRFVTQSSKVPKVKNDILQSLEEQKTASGSKKVRGCDYEQIDKAVFKWFTVQRSQNIPIDGNLIKEKALSFAKNFDCSSFKASDGWLDKWKKR
ncbi:tigger transposable element-derived protein 4-like [Hydractinia symbiolongicarpus]|uniref:tigger transposable element-derived protein 4-like n=1 Tax=Hydractinia symbiolongicarpus TaxID=13093 RepID=UPI00254D7826|nr:tigger transposable element-derived protein 4-like [Hydractinia symbiolongicarpus]